MYIASVCAYLIGSLSDIWIFGVIKKATKGKLLWLRATGSTVISQLIDSFIVSYIAFSLGKTLNGLPAASLEEVFGIAATGYGLKFFLAASLTPVLYLLKMLLTEKYGLQALPYDGNEADQPRPL
jgi:queuosine precursor transporter